MARAKGSAHRREQARTCHDKARRAQEKEKRETKATHARAAKKTQAVKPKPKQIRTRGGTKGSPPGEEDPTTGSLEDSHPPTESIPSWNDQVEACNHRISTARFSLATISVATIRGYGASLRVLARFINDLTPPNRDKMDVAPIPRSALKTENLPTLCILVGLTVSEPFWVQFLEFRANHGLPHLQNFRSALLKAQQAARSAEWAGDQFYIDITKAANIRAKKNRGDIKKVGAITEPMFQDLLAHIEHPEDELIRTFLSIQFYGCFRIGEVRTLEVSAVRDDGVWLFNPKQVRELEEEKWVFKPLGRWPGGRRSLDLIRQHCNLVPASSSFLFPTSLTDEIINEVISIASDRLQWDDRFRFRSHGLRHGGIQLLMKEKENDPPLQELCRWLLMTEESVRRYAKPNEERTHQPKSDTDDYDDSFSLTYTPPEATDTCPNGAFRASPRMSRRRPLLLSYKRHS